jgi:dTDP-4-amino-4,6-dideoxygalactose transaminase
MADPPSIRYGVTSSGWRRTECPVTEDVSDRIVRLPFFTSMTEDEQGRVIEEIISGCFK